MGWVNIYEGHVTIVYTQRGLSHLLLSLILNFMSKIWKTCMKGTHVLHFEMLNANPLFVLP